jgi:hypothetical protein
MSNPIDFQSQIKLPSYAVADNETVIKGQLDSVVTTHGNLTTAHSATSTPTASRIVMWNASTKLFSNTTVDADSGTTLTTKDYVLAKISQASLEGAAFGGTLATSATTQTVLTTPTTLNAPITLHNIARTGNYNDLLNQPTIPSTDDFVTIDTEQTISGEKRFINADTTFTNTIYIGNEKNSSPKISISRNSIYFEQPLIIEGGLELIVGQYGIYGTATTAGNTTLKSGKLVITKPEATANEFIKADGSFAIISLDDLANRINSVEQELAGINALLDVQANLIGC